MADSPIRPPDPPVGGRPIALSAATYARFERAVRYVEGLIRTRAPRAGTGRFPGAAWGAWGLLAAGDAIAAGSATALGTGTVTLCTKEGAALTDTGEAVTVYNAGAALDGGASGLAVPLLWAAGDWAVAQ